MHKLIIQKHKKARINKDEFMKAVLGNLVADLNTEAKNLKVDFLPDTKVIEILNKWIKRMSKLEETYKANNKLEAVDEVVREAKVYQDLLPKQLSELEIIEIIQGNKLTSIPEVMKYFSNNYFGRYNSKELINIFNNVKEI